MLQRLFELLTFKAPAERPVRVLVATSPAVREVVAPILAECPAEFVCDMRAGQQALAQAEYTHVVVGYLFAESQMFEFARLVRKAQPAAQVICVKVTGRRLSPAARYGLNEAVLALGCEGFFDLSAGDMPEAMFRSTFEEVLARFRRRKDKPREQAVVEQLRSAVHELRETAT